jgi:hypothetical protein
MSKDSAESRLLYRAMVISGGLSALAQRLEVSTADLKGWLDAETSPPEDKLLYAVCIVGEGSRRAPSKKSVEN